MPTRPLWVRHHLSTSAINLSTHEHSPERANLAHGEDPSYSSSCSHAAFRVRRCRLPRRKAKHPVRSLQASPKGSLEPFRTPLPLAEPSRVGPVVRESLGHRPEAFLTPPGHLLSSTPVTTSSDITAAIWYRPRTAPERRPAKDLAPALSSRCLPSPETSPL
jgi:hypothetical protein